MTLTEQYQKWLNESDAGRYGDEPGSDGRERAHKGTRGEKEVRPDPIKRTKLHKNGFNFKRGTTSISFTHDGSKEARAAAEAHYHGFKQEYDNDGSNGGEFTRIQRKARGLHFPNSPNVTRRTNNAAGGTHYHYAKKK